MNSGPRSLERTVCLGTAVAVGLVSLLVGGGLP